MKISVTEREVLRLDNFCICLHLFIKGMSDRTLKFYTAAAEELKRIPIVDVKIAQLILWFREIHGVVRKEPLILALQGDISPDVLDFTVPMNNDPLEIDTRLHSMVHHRKYPLLR